MTAPSAPYYYGGEVGFMYGHLSGKFGGDEFGAYIDGTVGERQIPDQRRCGLPRVERAVSAPDSLIAQRRSNGEARVSRAMTDVQVRQINN
jgi:hypothetical protein